MLPYMNLLEFLNTYLQGIMGKFSKYELKVRNRRLDLDDSDVKKQNRK